MYLAVVAELDPTVSVASDVLDSVRRLTAAGEHEAAGRCIPDDVLDRFAFSGTPEHVAQLVNAVIDAGASRGRPGHAPWVDGRGGRRPDRQAGDAAAEAGGRGPMGAPEFKAQASQAASCT